MHENHADSKKFNKKSKKFLWKTGIIYTIMILSVVIMYKAKCVYEEKLIKTPNFGRLEEDLKL